MSEAAAVAEPEAAWRIRRMQPGDLHFVLDSWLRSHRPDHPNLKQQQFFTLFRPLVTKVLAKPETRVLVACDPEDERHIVGWLAYTPPIDPIDRTTVHYAYVRSVYRGYGCGRALAEAVDMARGFVAYTCPSKTALALAEKVGAERRELEDFA